MSNAMTILNALDAELNCNVELTLYGRAALCLKKLAFILPNSLQAYSLTA